MYSFLPLIISSTINYKFFQRANKFGISFLYQGVILSRRALIISLSRKRNNNIQQHIYV
ncbi:hypothetical protein DDD_1531 [Nonlabens dokdonensis DSW-6]|uniref:Uncharacterized protein n=1 Tax=Nonlabens dokdonensis (strain DSM 17205 / KCTC 12402 / DSW-6) TaxID=592029 RepID=L7WCL1_NONDD|nr:hypothetical protein DDD_1531 [Nonlabens dokdonensis DSW-6]